MQYFRVFVSATFSRMFAQVLWEVQTLSVIMLGVPLKGFIGVM